MADHLIVETRDRVGILRINRPQRLNALNDELARDICSALFANDANEAIGCTVIMGNDKAFAAG
ncbi:MAG TPA: enoyl-CoA hydratase-related protein, partial [Casimicrobiaceae bacterium]|nr:enoyl-CoA hydratase-related protein [Casimicrobiaceae bacterium]